VLDHRGDDTANNAKVARVRRVIAHEARKKRPNQLRIRLGPATIRPLTVGGHCRPDENIDSH